jgi:hypothetical protein
VLGMAPASYAALLMEPSTPCGPLETSLLLSLLQVQLLLVKAGSGETQLLGADKGRDVKWSNVERCVCAMRLSAAW